MTVLSEPLLIEPVKTVGEIRRENIEVLVAEAGTLDAVAVAAESSAVYFSQLRKQAIDGKTGKPRKMGASIARRLEAAFKKPPGWMDQPQSAASNRAEEPPWAEYAGTLPVQRLVSVVGEARLGSDGYFEQMDHADGFVEGNRSDPDAYALRVKGDSMHPAIRHGTFVIVHPNGRCTPGEYVALQLTDGRKMVKELIIERQNEVVVESVNGNARMTIDRAQIEHMHPVKGQVPASGWIAR